MKTPPISAHNPRSGQAAAELAIGILLMAIVLFSLLFVGKMTSSSLYLHSLLRGEAGKRAMDSSFSLAPRPIADWDAGEDEVRHTADDQPKNNSVMISATLSMLTESSARTGDDWSHIMRDTRLPVSAATLHSASGLTAMLGFVRAKATLDVPVDPMVQQLMYNKETVAITEEVWMPLMGGLY